MSNKNACITPANPKSMGGLAFFPFIILIGIVILNILANVVMGLPQRGNSYPVVAVAVIAALGALFFGRGSTISQRVDAFCGSMAHTTTQMMILIMILAGIFAYVSTETGGIASLTNFFLQFIPANTIYVGIFIVSGVVSLSIGTSVGTLTAMAPIAAALVTQADLNMALALSAVVGGAVMGDNLSMISDTTIAATRGVGCEMKDKFRYNIMIVIPAIIITIIAYAILGASDTANATIVLEIGSYSVIKMLPYIYIIVAAVAGMNIMAVLASGIVLSAIIGFVCGEFTVMTFMSAVSGGVSDMTTVIFTALLVKGIMGVVQFNGGIEWLIEKLTSNVKTSKGAQFSVAAMAWFLGMLVRSTSAIIIAAPLAKTICDPYDIDPRRTASILDIFATAQSGLLPWIDLALIVTILAGGAEPVEVVMYGIYPVTITVIMLISIQFNLFVRKPKSAK